MSNSPLVEYTKISPFRTSPRTHIIDRITPHCVVGQCTIEALGAEFSRENKNASSNYGIDRDGRVGMFVEEKDRSFCSSNRANDHRAVTIECASDATHPYAFKKAVYEKLIELCIDICRRNGKTKLIWFGDKDKTLAYEPKEDEMVLTVHRWFANKACVPIETEVLTRTGWKTINEVEIGEEIACAILDDMSIIFSPVLDKVEPRREETYTINGFTATKDHRIVYHTQSDKTWKISDYADLLSRGGNIYIPLAGNMRSSELNMSEALMDFCVAVQAKGYYMYEANAEGIRSYHGVEFHFKKSSFLDLRVERLKTILNTLELEYEVNSSCDESTSIHVYNQNGLNIVEDICEKYLSNKGFTWDWIYMSQEQADFFMNEISFWNDSRAAKLYTSTDQINRDVISAITATHGYGSSIDKNDVRFCTNPHTTLSENHSHATSNPTTVSCLTVPTGIFLCRQHGNTFITGNCPGDWMYARMGDLAKKVTEALNPIQEDDEMLSYDQFKVYMDKYIEENPAKVAELFNSNMSAYRKKLQDNDSSNWSEDSRKWLVETGLVKGGTPLPNGDPNYMWEDFITREQMGTIMHRFAQNLASAFSQIFKTGK